mmetsp:Transcript_63730/g.201552  ORF Transcript_63730/g.201552 Transcript_63730/m.201552 type:complete len:204 (-) Transcript_63730:1081-1692(-)
MASRVGPLRPSSSPRICCILQISILAHTDSAASMCRRASAAATSAASSSPPASAMPSRPFDMSSMWPSIRFWSSIAKSVGESCVMRRAITSESPAPAATWPLERHTWSLSSHASSTRYPSPASHFFAMSAIRSGGRLAHPARSLRSLPPTCSHTGAMMPLSPSPTGTSLASARMEEVRSMDILSRLRMRLSFSSVNTPLGMEI